MPGPWSTSVIIGARFASGRPVWCSRISKRARTARVSGNPGLHRFDEVRFFSPPAEASCALQAHICPFAHLSICPHGVSRPTHKELPYHILTRGMPTIPLEVTGTTGGPCSRRGRMAGKKSSGLNKIGAALMALGEGRSDVSPGAAPLPLYHPEAHIHQAHHNKAGPEQPHDKIPHRRAG